MATSTSSGAPSRIPCAETVPLGLDGKPRIFTAAEIVPLGESRTESVEVNCASPANAVGAPSIAPEALRVPASAGDRALRSVALRSQRTCRAALETSPPAVSDTARPVKFIFSDGDRLARQRRRQLQGGVIPHHARPNFRAHA